MSWCGNFVETLIFLNSLETVRLHKISTPAKLGKIMIVHNTYSSLTIEISKPVMH